MAKDLQEGIEPPEAAEYDIYSIRSATYIADVDTSIDDGSGWLTKVD